MSLALAERPSTDTIALIRDYVQSTLPPLVDAIDKGQLYPADFMRGLGTHGAFTSHSDVQSCDLNTSIDAMSEVAEICGASGFMTWCQAALVWYVAIARMMRSKANCSQKWHLRKFLAAPAYPTP